MGIDWRKPVTLLRRRRRPKIAVADSKATNFHTRSTSTAAGATAMTSNQDGVINAVQTLLNRADAGAAMSAQDTALSTLIAAGPGLLAVTTPVQQQELAAMLIQRVRQRDASGGHASTAKCQPELELIRNLSRSANLRLAQTDAVLVLVRLIQRNVDNGAGEDADADMAMRTLNNVLMLHPTVRSKFSSAIQRSPLLDAGSSKDQEFEGTPVNSAEVTARLLQAVADRAASRPTIVFLAARLLFFSTLFENPFVVEAVERLEIIQTYSKCIVNLLPSATGTGAQAITELLKLAFNISLYYPRLRPERARAQGRGSDRNDAATEATATSAAGTELTQVPVAAGEAWAVDLDGLIRPTMRLFDTIPLGNIRPPLQPPMQQTIALMLNLPTKPSLALAEELGPPPTASSSKDPGQQESALLLKLYNLLALALHRYFPAAEESPSHPSSSFSPTSPPDIGLLQYATSDLDAEPLVSAARAQAVKDGLGGSAGDPEVGVEPLILLVRKYVSDDDGKAEEASTSTRRRSAKDVFRSRMLPDDLDRTTPPHKHPTMAGLLIRLMSSIAFPRLARAAGELLLALCNGSTRELSDTVGFGPAAGFLAAIGGGTTPTPPASGPTTDDGSNRTQRRPVDPITGRFDDLPELKAASASLDAMTPEEREREAERLFVLFERLNRTGVVSAPNPAKDEAVRARVEELDAEEAAALEKAEEQEALRDLAAYKKRTGRSKTDGPASS